MLLEALRKDNAEAKMQLQLELGLVPDSTIEQKVGLIHHPAFFCYRFWLNSSDLQLTHPFIVSRQSSTGVPKMTQPVHLHLQASLMLP